MKYYGVRNISLLKLRLELKIVGLHRKRAQVAVARANRLTIMDHGTVRYIRVRNLHHHRSYVHAVRARSHAHDSHQGVHRDAAVREPRL